MRARCVEDPLDADLELVRGGDGGAHRAPFVRWTTCAKRSSRCSHVVIALEGIGHECASAGTADLLRGDEVRLLEQPDVLLHPVSDMPKGSASSLIVALPPPSRSSTARRVGSARAANARSTVVVY